ncbi:PH domain-containing protein [Diplocarpon rosae]|nr:PH domain-containing protein [Diplocarpon rosae]
MAEVQRPAIKEPSLPRAIPRRKIPPLSTATLPHPTTATRVRHSNLNLDTFSPVNQNGSFEFDRVLKSGYVQKRTRKTKAWKPIYLVLRPNSLSIYRDQKEDKLRHKIHLSDLTAVVFLKDPKQKRQNVFGLFSSSRNYHLEATSRADAEEWVSLIRKEARIEEEEEEMLLASPSMNTAGNYSGFERTMQKQHEQRLHDERLGSSSPEPSEPIVLRQPTEGTGYRRPSHTIEYSGAEISDISDADITQKRSRSRGASVAMAEDVLAVKPPARPTVTGRTMSQLSGFNVEADPERVVWQGYLLYLKSVRGVRQWKDYWAVVRPRTIALYKNDAEYSPSLIIQLASVLNADTLDTSLGALKSLLAKREGKRAAR